MPRKSSLLSSKQVKDTLANCGWPSKSRKVEVHFDMDECLLKPFEEALRGAGFSTKSEFFRFKVREFMVEMNRDPKVKYSKLALSAGKKGK